MNQVVFEEQDPFNPQNIVKGLLTVGGKKNYGRLDIESVNGVPASQIILGTPKISYPFDKNGNYNFPSVDMMEIYEKLDGTNVFMYSYEAGGKIFITYKPRLRPFLVNSRFGPFQDMWKRMLERYPRIPKLFRDSPVYISGYSFELYGAENTHLIEYEVPLDTALLFAVTVNGDIEPPSWVSPMGVPSAVLIDRLTYDSPDFLIEEYKGMQEYMGENLIEKEETFVGSEGQIWYAYLGDTTWTMFKCKPHEIERIHWASSKYIHRNTILGATQNAFESTDDVTIDYVKDLLREEFEEETIKNSHDRIKKVVDQLNKDMFYYGEIERLLDGSDIDLENKGDVMRLLVGELKSKDKSIFKAFQLYKLRRENVSS